jgi:hypothetical protein
MGIFSNKTKTKSQLRGWEPAMGMIKDQLLPMIGSGMSSPWQGYQGDLTAGFTPYGRAGIDAMAGWGAGQGGDIQGMVTGAGAGALQNYNQMMGNVAGMGMPQNQGVNLQNVQDIVGGMNLEGARAAMLRDPYRGLTEQVLPGITTGMNANGMLNSSERMKDQSIALRGFADRAADVDSSLYSNAYNTALGIESQRAAQNPQLALGYMGQAGGIGNSMLGQAGNLLGQGFQMGQGNINNLLQAGEMERNLAQQGIDRNAQAHYMNQQLPFQQAQAYSSLLNPMAAQFGTQTGKSTQSMGVGNIAAGIGGSIFGGAMAGGYGLNPMNWWDPRS